MSYSSCDSSSSEYSDKEIEDNNIIKDNNIIIMMDIDDGCEEIEEITYDSSKVFNKDSNISIDKCIVETNCNESHENLYENIKDNNFRESDYSENNE